MPVQPFTIVNPDGSINQSEYERCVAFLKSYTSGLVPVTPKLTWNNPLEVDMSQQTDALTILYNTFVPENRLLTAEAFSHIKRLFQAVIEYYGCTLHTRGRYLEDSAEFVDGPGYMYDVLTNKDTPVLKNLDNPYLVTYYLDDEYHTPIEYNYLTDTNACNKYKPVANIGKDRPIEEKFNVTDWIYSSILGNLSGLYSDFQVNTGQYVGSSTLFYYAQCNDKLYTFTGDIYFDDRIQDYVRYWYRNRLLRAVPCRGFDLSRTEELRQNILAGSLVRNAHIKASVANPNIPYPIKREGTSTPWTCYDVNVD